MTKLFVVFLIALIVCAQAWRAPSKLSKPAKSCIFASSTDLQPAYDQLKLQLKAVVAEKTKGVDLPTSTKGTLTGFLDQYLNSNAEAGTPPERCLEVTKVLLREVMHALHSPHQFKPYHQAIREPFDYYKWANEFFKPLIKAEKSKVVGVDNLRRIQEYLQRGENVVLLSNHQTEADPQVISLLLETYPDLAPLAEQMIFIAGHKVTNDPVAIPYSMGRNLICIHSKKHIKNPPEETPQKLKQNLESMQAMSELFSQGGKCFWVAPSGGRDRPNETDKFVVAPFDVKALDMFKILAMQSQKPAHFFPMAMFTHQLVPPPKTLSSSLGEERNAQRGEVSIDVLAETDGLGGLKDKEFAANVQRRVEEAYEALNNWHYSPSA